jgi:hypothetical protein
MSTKKHMIQVFMQGQRWVASELNGVISVSRDGEDVGKAKWHKDQLVLNSAMLPDEVCLALEVKLKERMDANWDED